MKWPREFVLSAISILPAAAILFVVSLALRGGDAGLVSSLAVVATIHVSCALAAILMAFLARVLCHVFLRPQHRDGENVTMFSLVLLAALAAFPLAETLLASTRFSGSNGVAWWGCCLAVMIGVVAAVTVRVVRGADPDPRRALAYGLAFVGGSILSVKFFSAQYPLWHFLVATWSVILLLQSLRILSQWVPKASVLATAGLLIGLICACLPPGAPPLDPGLDPLSRLSGTRALLWPWEADVEASMDPLLLSGRWGRSVSGKRGQWLKGRGGEAPRKIILVTVDALRADHVGFMGYARETTPFLDGMARESTVFENAYAQSSSSLGSIMSIFTGRYPASLNAWRKTARKGPPVEEYTLAETLAGRGFKTMGIPAYARPPLAGIFRSFSRGFGEYPILAGRSFPPAEKICDEGLRFLRQGAGDQLFLWLHFLDVHSCYESDSSPFGDGPVDLYDGGILHVDKALGAFWQAADGESLLDDALIVFLSDHGEEFGEHGGRYHGSTLFEEQIKVPLMIWMKGAGVGRVKTPVELVDVFPTVTDILGIAPKAGVHGDSLVPQMLGDAANGIVVSQVLSMEPLAPNLTAIVDGTTKAIRSDSTGAFEVYDLSLSSSEYPSRAVIDRDVRSSMSRKLFAARQVTASPPEIRQGFQSHAGPFVISPDMQDPEVLKGLLGQGGGPHFHKALEAALLGDATVFGRELETLLRESLPDVPLRDKLLSALVRHDARAMVPAIRRVLEPVREMEVASDFLEVLGRLGNSGDLGWLARWSENQEAAVRIPALICATRLGDPAAREVVLDKLPSLGARDYFLSLAALDASGHGVARDTMLAGVLAVPQDSGVCVQVLRTLQESGDAAWLPLLGHIVAVPGVIPPRLRDMVVNLLGPASLDDPVARLGLYRLQKGALPRTRGQILAWLGAGVMNVAPLLDDLERRNRETGKLWPGGIELVIEETGTMRQWSGSTESVTFVSMSAPVSAPGGVFAVHVHQDGREGHVAAGLLVEDDGHCVLGARLTLVRGQDLEFRPVGSGSTVKIRW